MFEQQAVRRLQPVVLLREREVWGWSRADSVIHSHVASVPRGPPGFNLVSLAAHKVKQPGHEE